MRLTKPGQDFELQFCSECKFYGEPNGCNNPDACESFDYFTEVADRLQKYEDLFEKWGIDKFDAQQIDNWHDRMLWHVKKCDELREKLRKYEHLEEMGCKYKNECPSYTGWCEAPEIDFEKCIPFIIAAYENEKHRLDTKSL